MGIVHGMITFKLLEKNELLFLGFLYLKKPSATSIIRMLNNFSVHDSTLQ